MKKPQKPRPLSVGNMRLSVLHHSVRIVCLDKKPSPLKPFTVPWMADSHILEIIGMLSEMLDAPIDIPLKAVRSIGCSMARSVLGGTHGNWMAFAVAVAPHCEDNCILRLANRTEIQKAWSWLSRYQAWDMTR